MYKIKRLVEIRFIDPLITMLPAVGQCFKINNLFDSPSQRWDDVKTSQIL
jgi:hypothetical protein